MQNTRLNLYKEAMELERERASVQSQLDSLNARLGKVYQALFGDLPRTSKGAPAPSPASAPVRRRGGRAGRGELTRQIIAALEGAGGQPVTVPEIASTLGVKPANLHAWFQQTGRRIPQIKKAGRGQYKLVGSVNLPNGTEVPAVKPASTGKRKGGRARRGGLAERVLGALSSAGKTGIKIKELSEKLGVKYQNLSVWFATTGKKNAAIKKIGEAHYRLEE